MRLSKIGPTVLALAFGVASSGCSLLGFDRREAVAYRTLFDASGNIDKTAYSAAITTRFPRGSSVVAVREYVAANGGECHDRESGNLWCEIAYRAQFCAAAMIGIEVITRDASGESLRVEIGGLSCGVLGTRRITSRSTRTPRRRRCAPSARRRLAWFVRRHTNHVLHTKRPSHV
jgi:hypothetical protein